MIDQRFKPFILTGYEYRTEREKQFELKRTVIDVKLNFEEKSVEGKVELDLKVNSLPQETLEIDAGEMEIYNVSANGTPVRFDSFKDKIFVYGDFRAFGNYILNITYKAFPRKGGYFVEEDGETQFWTQGESMDNHFWFPCPDYPNMRSSYEIRVTVPNGYTVISNGVPDDKVEGDFTTFVFKESFRFPAYLVSVVAGKFQEKKQEWQGVPITSYFSKKYSDVAERSFINSVDMMNFISEKTGVKYPYSKYDQTCVADFVYGGMENLNATTLTDRTLHDEVAHLDYKSESLLCHEMAHQWFGDYVTCKDWSQAWLNEGFATYIALIYMEKFKGKDEFLVEVQKTKDAYLKEFSEDYGRPIVERKYRDPEELFDRHLYQKASLFLRYLNYYLGDKIFWEGVKSYLESNAGNSVSTDDFRKSLSKVSGFSLEGMFHQFVEEPGHPEIKIEESRSKNKIAIRILQKGKKYELMVPIRIYFEDRTEDKDILVQGEITDFEVDRKDFKALSFDPESVLLRTVQYERPREETRFILINGHSVLERGAAALELVKYNTVEIPLLQETFETEQFWWVKGKIAEAISKIGGKKSSRALLKLLEEKDYLAREEVVKAVSNLEDDELYEKLREMFDKEEGYYIRANILASAQKSGREESKNLLINGLGIEAHDDVIRIGALSALGELADPTTIETVKKYYGKKYKWQTRAATVRAVGKFYWRERSVSSFLLNALKDSFFAVRNAAVEAIKDTGDFDLIGKVAPYMEKETDGRVRRTIRETLEIKGPSVPEEFKSLKEEMEKLRERVSNLETNRKTKK